MEIDENVEFITLKSNPLVIPSNGDGETLSKWDRTAFKRQVGNRCRPNHTILHILTYYLLINKYSLPVYLYYVLGRSTYEFQ